MGVLDLLGLRRPSSTLAADDELFDDEFQRKLEMLAMVARRRLQGRMRAERRENIILLTAGLRTGKPAGRGCRPGVARWRRRRRRAPRRSAAARGPKRSYIRAFITLVDTD